MCAVCSKTGLFPSQTASRGSGLSEALELYWDRLDRLCVDLSGKRPMLRIPAELEKGNQDRLLALAPEFAEFLLETPEDERHGRVFKLPGIKPARPQGGGNGAASAVNTEWASKVVCRIGEAAGVKVNTTAKRDRKTGGRVEVVKCASAHDLRRSFGERWAVRVMPQVLKEMMRHEDIETTMRYYVGRNAQTTADVLWAAYEAKRGSTSTVSCTAGQEKANANEKRPS